MPAQDTTQLKEKIMSVLKTRGPSLPVHIAGEIGLSILFTSAFLSELLAERKIKISNLKIGSSPIYFIPGQEPSLEKFSHHLKSKEKDAYILLKEMKFLEDSKLEPAIRVALRQIKDFAIPFQKQNTLFWRFYTTSESDFKHNLEPIQKNTLTTPPKTDTTLIELPQKIMAKPDLKPSTTNEPGPELEIFDNKQKPEKKKPLRKKPSQKKNEKFFNNVKEFLNNKSIDILDIESFNKNDLVLRIKSNNHEKLLIAFNKKRLAESDILKAGKKAEELSLPYIILSSGGPLKKIENLIHAVKNLDKIEKL